jgi:hypothetical protein
MRRQPKLPETRYGWWRFDRYQIQNGVIRPAAGSRLTWYDPWVTFQQIRNQTNGQPAYSELTRLASKLNADPATKGYLRDLSQESESAILAWCGGHGLLGVLLSRWESVTLSPRPAGPDREIGTQVRYLRGYGTTIGMVHTKGDLPEARSSVLIHPLHDLTTKEEPLVYTWARFFPSVPEQERETFAYPIPYSQEFWELYAEPMSEFWRAARLFTGAVQHLGASAKPIAGGARASTETEALARAQAVDVLNLLRKDVSQVLLDEDGGLRQEWVSPSLLASFAEMFVLDLMAGRRSRYCECCGLPFIWESYQARYCSTACRLRQQKRNLRAHIKQARTSFLEGQTIRKISKTLGEAPESVQRWVAGLKRGRKGGRS